MDDVNAATMGGEEGNNTVQEQPSVDSINASSMGGGVEINITQEQSPSMDDVNATAVGGEEDHQLVQYDLAAEGTSTANGSCDLT